MKGLIFLFTFFIAVHYPTMAQYNFVRNGGFDTLTECPDFYEQVDRAIGWHSIDYKDKGDNPSLFNECASNLDFSVPESNEDGVYCYQEAKSRGGYVGISVFYDSYRYHMVEGSSFYGRNFHRFVQSKLIQNLSIDKKYYIKFYVNPHNIRSLANTYIDKIGLGLSDTQYNEIDPATGVFKYLNAAIEYKKGFIDDTINWTKVSGCYTATGKEQYVIVGNFQSDKNTNWRLDSNWDVGPLSSDMFIEDVGVYEYNPLPDTVLLCNGTAKTFNITFLDAQQYQWSTGSRDSVYTFSKEGKYWVKVIIDGCDFTDSTVVIDTRTMPLHFDKLLCNKGRLILSSPLSGSHKWSNGAEYKELEISEPGIYTLSVKNECGVFDFSFNVESQQCSCEVYFPNAFTPNNDGKNDVFKPIDACDYPIGEMEFIIVNRYGQVVFQSKNINSGWDGKFNGMDCEMSTYFYLYRFAEQTIDRNESRKTRKGDIILIR